MKILTVLVLGVAILSFQNCTTLGGSEPCTHDQHAEFHARVNQWEEHQFGETGAFVTPDAVETLASSYEEANNCALGDVSSEAASE